MGRTIKTKQAVLCKGTFVDARNSVTDRNYRKLYILDFSARLDCNPPTKNIIRQKITEPNCQYHFDCWSKFCIHVLRINFGFANWIFAKQNSHFGYNAKLVTLASISQEWLDVKCSVAGVRVGEWIRELGFGVPLFPVPFWVSDVHWWTAAMFSLVFGQKPTLSR